MTIFNFFKELWTIFKEAFSFDYNNTLFCAKQNIEYSNQPDEFLQKIERRKSIKSYTLHFFIIFIILILFSSIMNVLFFDIDFPKINYENSHLISNNAELNYSTILLVINNTYTYQDTMYDLNQYSDVNYTTENNFTMVDSKNYTLLNSNAFSSHLVSKLKENYDKYPLIIVFGDDFVSYNVYDVSYKTTILNISELDANFVFKILLFLFFIIEYVLIFVIALLYSLVISQIYNFFSLVKIPFGQIFKFIIYSFISASLINLVLYLLLGINIYILILMLIFVFNSMAKYKSNVY